MAWRVQTTSHYLNQWWLVYRRIYASLGLNKLIHAVQISIEYRYEDTKDIAIHARKIKQEWAMYFAKLLIWKTYQTDKELKDEIITV